MKQLLLLSCALLLSCLASSQVQLVKDILTGSNSAFDYGAPRPVVLQNTIIFAVDDGVHGMELWKSNGTAAGTVLLKDIMIGSQGSQIKDLTVAGNYVFFTANDGTHGAEIWRTDGTTAGTKLLDDINTGGDGVPSFVYGKKALAVGDNFFYIATDGFEKGIWMTDGTPGNAVKIKQSDDIKDLVSAWNGKAIFTEYRYSGSYEADIWESDGTPVGTVKIQSLQVTFSGITDMFVPIGNLLYFVMSTPVNGYELWATDGTPSGTSIVKDVNPGFSSGIDPNFGQIKALNQQLIFTVTQKDTLQELWRSDGTTSGTVKIKNLPARYQFLPAGLGHTEMLDMGDYLLFSIFNLTNGERELWSTDGTEAGTSVVLSNPNGTYLTPTNLYRVGDRAFFSGVNNKGRELWKSDGTPAGTQMVADIYTGGSSSSPSLFVNVNDTLYFAAQSSGIGSELRKLVVTTVDTKDLLADPMAFQLFPNPSADKAVLVFSAEKWRGMVIRIFNSEGQQVWIHQADAAQVNLPATVLTNGLYWIQVGNSLQKWVVQH